MEILGFNIDVNDIQHLILGYGKLLVIGLFLLVLGLWLINKTVQGFGKVLRVRNIDETLIPFLVSMISVTLKVLLFISVISYVGIPMTSFIALLGAAGLAVGMALSGTMQNFAGGVILLIIKPFKVGDFIEAQGFMGTVMEIQVFNTILLTPDNKTVIIPNGGLATGALTNYSKQETRRVEITFGIGYGDDIDKARSIIQEVIRRKQNVLAEPAPFVAVSSLGDSSVNLVTRVWTQTAEYWDVHFYLVENVKKEFDKQGISIPFPQRDIHIINK